MMTKTLVFSALAILVSSTPALAQSPLADAARREAERRKAGKAVTVTIYTNDDLSRLPVRSVPLSAPPSTRVTTMGPGGDTTPAPAAAVPGTVAEAPRDEKYWRERITTARTNLSRAEMFAEALQTRINSLSADFVNRDDPAQRAQIAEQRQKALDEMARVQKEVADLNKLIRDIEDEARRAGVPPGWLR